MRGLQNTSSSDGGKSLTNEEVAGKVAGAARSEAAEQKGRGRAIALLPPTVRPDLPVDVLFHLHGNTEHAGRDYAGWRQHKDTGAVRDVERDRIAQQIEATKSSQLVGILPMGMNQSQFGAISPDAYIGDAFDRLAELGAWKAAPKTFRVVLSAHSGGGFTVEKMMRGHKGFQLPQNLGMIILFEANNSLKNLKKGEQQAFTAWAIGQLNAHLSVLTSSRSDAEKRAYLGQATRLRAFFDPRKGHSYGAIYRPLRTAVDDWFSTNGSKLGGYLAETRSLIEIVEQSVGHERQMQSGLGSALTALPGTPTAGSVGSPTARTAATASPPVPLDARAAAITAAQVGAHAGSLAPVAMLAFALATGHGLAPLPAAARSLATAGVSDRTNLTDALFALVRPELGGRTHPGRPQRPEDRVARAAVCVRPPGTGLGGQGGWRNQDRNTEHDPDRLHPGAGEGEEDRHPSAPAAPRRSTSRSVPTSRRHSKGASSATSRSATSTRRGRRRQATRRTG